MIVVVGCLVILLLVFIVEAEQHQERLDLIPLRILVNGTRGKSSVVRLIAAGLNAGGISAVAKTTGSATRLILPDGTEETLARNGPVNIIEQVGVVRRAEKLRPRALVVECMSLRPELQRTEAARLIQPHITVITNVGPDHHDVMGADLAAVAKALSGTIPRQGQLFTAEQDFFAVLEKEAIARDTAAHFIDAAEQDFSSLKLGYIEHPENLALALAVCQQVGVDREAALSGFQRARPDPGVLRMITGERNGIAVSFVNAFAANDPVSIAKIWRLLRLDQPDPGRRVVAILNLRRDRPHRNAQLLAMLGCDICADEICLIGDSPAGIRARLLQDRALKARTADYSDASWEALMRHLTSRMSEPVLFIGLGNMAGWGARIVEYFGALDSAC